MDSSSAHTRSEPAGEYEEEERQQPAKHGVVPDTAMNAASAIQQSEGALPMQGKGQFATSREPRSVSVAAEITYMGPPIFQRPRADVQGEGRSPRSILEAAVSRAQFVGAVPLSQYQAATDLAHKNLAGELVSRPKSQVSRSVTHAGTGLSSTSKLCSTTFPHSILLSKEGPASLGYSIPVPTNSSISKQAVGESSTSAMKPSEANVMPMLYPAEPAVAVAPTKFVTVSRKPGAVALQYHRETLVPSTANGHLSYRANENGILPRADRVLRIGENQSPPITSGGVLPQRGVYYRTASLLSRNGLLHDFVRPKSTAANQSDADGFPFRALDGNRGWPRHRMPTVSRSEARNGFVATGVALNGESSRSSRLTHRFMPVIDRHLQIATVRASTLQPAQAQSIDSGAFAIQDAAGGELPTVQNGANATPPTLSASAMDLTQLTGRVYDLLVRRLASEQSRRGT